VQVLGYFFTYGTNPSIDSSASTLEALHDNSVSFALAALLRYHPRVVAIIGGHRMRRGSPAYVDVAGLAWALAAAGVLVVSGGGPGAMEATHLGAFFSRRPRTELEGALLEVGDRALPENAARLVDDQGRIDPGVAADLHGWLAPAFGILETRTASASFTPGISLAVPTWLYGYEPTTPLATHVAKYFQNSIREDGLVSIARQGIVYAEGSAGTVQEIFQDAAQNRYGAFCPMVFLSSPGTDYWSRTLPVRPLVEALLGGRPDYASKVLFTESADAALAFLSRQP
jgi:predicted Rossmann-fold nucleotide-binding protein